MTSSSDDPWANLPTCERCGEKLYGGSHYHCAGCDSTDVTSMYGHHIGGHWNDGKFTKSEFHHCPPEERDSCPHL